MSAWDDIRSAFETTLEGISGIPEISWQNQQYDPVTGTAYVRFHFIPGSRTIASLGLNGSSRPNQFLYTGLSRVLLYYPEKIGVGTSEDMVDTISDAFESATDLSFTNSDLETVYVTIDTVEMKGSLEQKPWYITPVEIDWYCYHNK